MRCASVSIKLKPGDCELIITVYMVQNKQNFSFFLTAFQCSSGINLPNQQLLTCILSLFVSFLQLWRLCCFAMPTSLKSTKTVFLIQQVSQQAGSVLLDSSWWATSRYGDSLDLPSEIKGTHKIYRKQ